MPIIINFLLTSLARDRTGENWPSVVFARTSLRSVRTTTTSGQYSPVRPSRSAVSKKLVNGHKNENNKKMVCCLPKQERKANRLTVI